MHASALRWAAWRRHRHVEAVEVDIGKGPEGWLVGWGPTEAIDVLSPAPELKQTRPQPLYARFLSDFAAGGTPAEMARSAVAFAREYGLLGLFHREYPHHWVFGDYALRRRTLDADGHLVRLSSTPYAKAARELSRIGGDWGRVAPWQVEPVSGWLGAYMELSAVVGLAGDDEAASAWAGVDMAGAAEHMRGELRVVMADGAPVVEVAYASLLDGMLLRAAYDRATDGRPLLRCQACGAYFLPSKGREERSRYCSVRCAKAFTNHAYYEAKTKPKRQAKQAGSGSGAGGQAPSLTPPHP